MAKADIIDGKAFAEKLRGRVTKAVATLKQDHGITPGLAVVLAGEDPASQIYVRNKAKQTIACGMQSFEHRLPADTDEKTLLQLVDVLNHDPSVHGILVQLPLPPDIDVHAVIDAIDPDKDVDGFHVINAGRLATGAPALVPCTPMACLTLIQDRLGDLSGMDAVVIGRSNIVGRPMAELLLWADCTVTVAHSLSHNLPAICRWADILVVAAGDPELVRGDWVKPGATVIDVGINRVPAAEPGKTRIVGDVAFDEVSAVAGAITPVPGGVGPMTIATLLRNTVVATCRQNGLPDPDI